MRVGAGRSKQSKIFCVLLRFPGLAPPLISPHLFMYESIYIGNFSRETRIFFSVGVVWAFTTFSALAVQSFQAGPVIGIANILPSLILGLIGILAGRHLISYQRWT